MTKIFAHRGSSGTLPENTLPAFRRAVVQKTDGIELDVHLSRDGHLIVMHDETVERTTDGQGWLKDLSLAEIKELNAGANFEAVRLQTQVPTLPEVFELLTELNFRGCLNIEIKTDIVHYQGIEATLVAFVQSQQPAFEVLFSSFHLPSLELLHQLWPASQLAYLFHEEQDKAELAEAAAYLTGLHPKISWSRLHDEAELGYRKAVRTWTVNEAVQMQHCFAKKVSAIFTDFPEIARQIREVTYE